jgi:hypothetical protein
VPDLRGALEAHRRGEESALARFAALYQLGDDGGDRFARFQAKYNLLTAASAFRRQPEQGPLRPAVFDELSWLVDGLVARWREQGLVQVELRFMLPARLSQGQARQCLLHLLEGCRRHSDSAFRLDLILSLPRWRPGHHWPAIERVLREHRRGEHLVGVDFCHHEAPEDAARIRPFAEGLWAFNAEHPQRALALLIHVGEQIATGGLEGHLLQVLDALELGAHRLGHALVAGLDLAVFAGQRRQETRERRLAQIDRQLALGEAAVLHEERQQVAALPAGATVELDYGPLRLARCQDLQAQVLAALARRQTVVECCPTSNRLVLGLRDAAAHPIHRFHTAGLALAIASDDAGIFGTSLPEEWAWSQAALGLSPEAVEAWQQRHAAWCSRVLSGRISGA